MIPLFIMYLARRPVTVEGWLSLLISKSEKCFMSMLKNEELVTSRAALVLRSRTLWDNFVAHTRRALDVAPATIASCRPFPSALSLPDSPRPH